MDMADFDFPIAWEKAAFVTKPAYLCYEKKGDSCFCYSFGYGEGGFWYYNYR